MSVDGVLCSDSWIHVGRWTLHCCRFQLAETAAMTKAFSSVPVALCLTDNFLLPA